MAVSKVRVLRAVENFVEPSLSGVLAPPSHHSQPQSGIIWVLSLTRWLLQVLCDGGMLHCLGHSLPPYTHTPIYRHKSTGTRTILLRS